jgi:hypothetical protein
MLRFRAVSASRANITPPVGIYARNWGAAKHDVARAIHRSLTLTDMTLAPTTGACDSLSNANYKFLLWRDSSKSEILICDDRKQAFHSRYVP